MSIMQITRAEAMCIAAFQEHLDVTEKVSIYYLEEERRWVHHNQCVFLFLPLGIDENDEEATDLLLMVQDTLSVARGEV